VVFGRDLDFTTTGDDSDLKAWKMRRFNENYGENWRTMGIPRRMVSDWLYRTGLVDCT